MVYEIKCHNCGKIADWGGREPKDRDGNTRLPDNIMEFDGNKYCEECVEKFVKFGIGEIDERIDYLEDRMEEALDALGISKAKGAE